MSLAFGAHLGAYEIIGPLGAGGMGEVYRAKDTRLGREVAIKVLSAAVVTDPDRLARFEREARAVSALNHPNIVTLYEVGSGEAGPYLVLECVEGQSLRRLIDAGPVPIKKLLDLGAQIAAGLAKAHAAGIVHRDLKPANVMVTNDGFAKILDFGLARLVGPDEKAAESAETATFVEPTASGVILGTLGYLSPEQAAGKPADYRADQFALGALLYEMATGAPPFKRDTKLDSLAATVRDEPEAVRTRRPDLPAPVAWLIERCLAKLPDDRYASTKDLARDLAELRDRLSEISKVPVGKAAPEASRVFASRWIRTTLALVLVSTLVAATFVIARSTAATVPVPSFQPLTFDRGTITGARFGPDGRTVYYSATHGAGPSQIFVTRLDRTESKPLDLPPGFLMGVSARDELVILETDRRDCCTAVGTLARVPAMGGTPRQLTDKVLFADWAHDGERIAIVRPDVCEYLNGPTIAPGCSFLRVSPVNDDVAFTRSKGLEVHNGAGTLLAATDMPLIYGLAWSPDGQEVWFSGSETGASHDRAIYALSSLDGRRRLVARAPAALGIYDVSSDGKSALISTGAGWFGINAVSAETHEERTLDLNGRTQIAGLSDDGRWLLLNEDREVGGGVWLRSTDGKEKFYLSDEGALGLSPDGKWALIQRRGSPTRLVLQPIGVGQPVDVPVQAELEAPPGDWRAAWSNDQRRLFLQFSRVGGGSTKRVFVREADAPWKPVTPERTGGPFAVSPDGEVVATNDETGALSLYYVDGRPSRRLEGELGRAVHWSADGRQLMIAAPAPFPMRLYHYDLTTGRIEPWRTVVPADPTGVTAIARVVADREERSYIYQYVRGLNDLYLARNLR